MSDEQQFTISTFYNFVNEKRLMAAKCSACGNVILPPKPMCTQCLSTDLNWIELECSGKLVSYTVIHVAPEQFQSLAPYIVGIVEFKNGLRLPGMINDVHFEDVKIGMDLKLCFGTSTSSQWPSWSRYFFRPV
ncbi:MAG: Zn-ribbon domain-containing OB-fold protein [Candidatus Bathyarchaeota archaeon]|nr:Zn-ribbon domain-containing OB-fold protein [Candidatus Bathyarchaeum sp.]